MAVAKAAFLGEQFRIDPADRAWPGAAVRWVFSPQRDAELRTNINDTLRAYITVEIADLDGSGIAQQLVLVDAPFNWQGDWHTLLRLPSGMSLDDVLARGQREVLSKSDFVIGPPPYGVHNVWYDPRIAQIGKFYYLLDVAESSLTLYRIRSAGPLEPDCVVSLAAQGNAPLDALSGTKVGALFSLLEQIAATDDDCGTLQPGTRLALSAALTKSRVALRPWSLHDGGDPIVEETYIGRNNAPYNERERVDRFLEAWGHQSLWNFRLYRDLAALEQDAISTLSTYYAAAFGVSEHAARAEAERVMDQVIRRHFVFPSNNGPVEPNLLGQLHRLVLDGGPVAKIDQILNANPGIDRAINEPHSDETLIFFALEYPDLVGHLLDIGYSANDSNWFGKSPLMYAAQFNLEETARLLLHRGADPNAQLKKSKELACQQRIGITDRTSLMYAAENGSLEVIRLLLERGANPRATDVGRHGVLDYLARNQLLSGADRSAAEQLLSGTRP